MKRSHTIGRHELGRVPESRFGYPEDIPISQHNTSATITPVVVVDVYDGLRRHRAMARIDLLDRERRARRIDEASFLIGREIEVVFERMRRIGGSVQWLAGDHIDAAPLAAARDVGMAEAAVQVNAVLRWMARHLGKVDTRLVWYVLGEGWSFVQTASLFGCSTDWRGSQYIAHRFRDALGTLAAAKAAKGRRLRK